MTETLTDHELQQMIDRDSVTADELKRLVNEIILQRALISRLKQGRPSA